MMTRTYLHGLVTAIRNGSEGAVLVVELSPPHAPKLRYVRLTPTQWRMLRRVRPLDEILARAIWLNQEPASFSFDGPPMDYLAARITDALPEGASS